MSVVQIDHDFLGIELNITPDDEYEYLMCKNITDNSHILLRRKGEFINFWNTQKVEWHPGDYSFKTMKHKDQLVITIVTSDLKITLPTRDRAYEKLKSDNN